VGVLVVAVLVGTWATREEEEPDPAVDSVQTAPVGGADPVADVEPAADAAPELSAVERAERALASTAALHCPDALGAGFFVTPDLILTNAHVATCDSAMEVVLADGRQRPGTVLRRDTRLDLAVVRAPGLDVTPLPLADAGELRVGDRVTLVGSPVGLEFTVHEGSVSSLPRMVLGVAYIQLDAKINPGNSGGPLIDERGRVVGVVSLKHTGAEGIGLALPINYAWDDAASLVPPPGGDRKRTPGFARMVEQVAAKEREAVAQIAETPQQPLLVAGGWDRYDRLVAVVVRVASHVPAAEDFDVVVRAQNKRCEFRGQVARWKRVEAKGGESQSAMDARVRQWLESVGAAADVYAGEMVLSLQPCRLRKLSTMYRGQQGPFGSVLVELEGADPRAARLQM